MKLILASEFGESFQKVQDILRKENISSGRAVYIPTAAYGEGYEPDPETNEKLLEKMGFEVTVLDLANKTQAQLSEAFNQAVVVYVGGGNTYYLLEQMNKSGFRDVLKSCLAEGMIYIGSSAGSAVCCPDIQYIHEMDDPKRASLTSTEGLGLVGFAILPHMHSPSMGDAANKVKSAYNCKETLHLLSDKQLIYVQGHSYEII